MPSTTEAVGTVRGLNKDDAQHTPAFPAEDGGMPSTMEAVGTVRGLDKADAQNAPALPEGEVEMPSVTGAAGAVHGLHTANVRIYAQLKQYARQMRQVPTPAERILWRALRGEKAGAYFRRQHVLGNFIVDFVSLEHRLVIEVDGDIHDHQEAEDALRTQWLNRTSFHVIRFRNEEVIDHLADVMARIRQVLAARPSIVPPCPPRVG